MKPDRLRPFVAPTLLRATGDEQGEALLDAVINVVEREAAVSTKATDRQLIATTDVDLADSGMALRATSYRETAAPPWLIGPYVDEHDHHDVRHQLVVVAVRGPLVAICASDAAMRDRIVKEIGFVRKLAGDVIASFVGGQTKVIWLVGVHTPTTVKPDNKMLTGSALEDAIDPIGDQSYFYSAARSIPQIDAFKNDKGDHAVVGAAPGNSRLWLRRAKDWEKFKALTEAIFDHVESGAGPSDHFSSLSQSVAALNDVSAAYGLAVVPPELLSDDELELEEREKANRWAYEAVYVVSPRDTPDVEVAIELDGSQLGVMELSVTMDDAGHIEVTPQWLSRDPARPELADECEKFLGDVQKIKIFYENAHTIAQGRCYLAGYTDVKFDWRFEDFGGYELKDEKPKGKPLAERIGVDGDNSLFAFVLERLFVKDKKPFGWLACDDGSMEMADFIHIDPDAKLVSLVHVKASSKDEPARLAAPAEYEIVVNQAVKNIRYLSGFNLVERLTEGKGKKIGAAVWRDGKRVGDRKEFIKVAKDLGDDHRKQLVVVQPRVTQAEWKRCWAPGTAKSHALRIKQIDTMLLAARVSAQAMGANFVAIGDLAGHQPD